MKRQKNNPKSILFLLGILFACSNSIDLETTQTETKKQDAVKTQAEPKVNKPQKDRENQENPIAAKKDSQLAAAENQADLKSESLYLTKHEAPKGGYKLSVKGTKMGSNKVMLTLTSNIPGTIQVMAGVGLAGQKDDDIFIGKNSRVTLKEGAGQVMFDVSQLPKGKYNLEADFYPRWGFQDERSKLAKITKDIAARGTIRLQGSGKSAKAEDKKNKGQYWVMMNVTSDTKWKPNQWAKKFGSSTPVTVDRYNPKIIKGFYFPSIDLTVFVNALEGNVSHWRIGKAKH